MLLDLKENVKLKEDMSKNASAYVWINVSGQNSFQRA